MITKRIEMLRIILLIVLSVFLFECQNKEIPIAKKGKLDLKNWDFSQELLLAGEWEFYWNQLCYSDQNANSNVCNSQDRTSYIKMPGLWYNLSHIKSKPPITGLGYATHRLYVLTNTKEKLSLRIQNVYTAYKLWINGKLITEVGKLGMSKTSSKPKLYPKIVELPSAENGLEIVLQVSNYHHKKGGAWKKIYLGKTEKILLEKEKKLALDLFISGSLFFVGFYHIIYFWFRKKDKATLHFGLFAMIISLRILLVEEPFLYRVIPNFPYELGMRLEFLTAYLPASLFILFISDFLFFHGFKQNKVYDFILIVPQILLSLVVVFASPLVFTKTLSIMDLFIAISMLYILHKMLMAIRQKMTGGFFLLVTYLILCGFVINDILYKRTLVNTGYYLSYGFMIFIFAHRIAMVKGFAKILNRLEELNQNLETLVETRTKEYKEEKQRAEEANSLKDKFMFLVTHDLKSPISSIKSNTDYVLTTNALTKEEKDSILKDNSLVLGELSSMISRLLNLNRLKTTNYTLNYKHIDLQKLVDQIFVRLSSVAKEKGIQLVNLAPEETILTVDESLFQEVIYNLCHNSIKFSYSGCVVKVFHSIDNGHIVSIEDNGFGMSQEKVSNIWKDGFSKQTPGTNGEIGSGIGLLLCQEIIKLHHGQIMVDSKPHQKTCFQVKLPMNEKIVFVLAKKENFSSWIQNKDLSTMYIHCSSLQQVLSLSQEIMPDVILTENGFRFPSEVFEKNKDLATVDIKKINEFDKVK